jgi:hypothetical protein
MLYHLYVVKKWWNCGWRWDNKDTILSIYFLYFIHLFKYQINVYYYIVTKLSRAYFKFRTAQVCVQYMFNIFINAK